MTHQLGIAIASTALGMFAAFLVMGIFGIIERKIAKRFLRHQAGSAPSHTGGAGFLR